MNLILHGIDAPSIVLTNPPFGGHERKGLVGSTIATCCPMPAASVVNTAEEAAEEIAGKGQAAKAKGLIA